MVATAAATTAAALTRDGDRRGGRMRAKERDKISSTACSSKARMGARRPWLFGGRRRVHPGRPAETSQGTATAQRLGSRVRLASLHSRAARGPWWVPADGRAGRVVESRCSRLRTRKRRMERQGKPTGSQSRPSRLLRGASGIQARRPLLSKFAEFSRLRGWCGGGILELPSPALAPDFAGWTCSHPNSSRSSKAKAMATSWV